MTSHSDVIRDVTRHVHQSYKTAWHRIGKDTLVQLLLGGTRTRMNRHTGAPVLREPTSFKHSWLGCFSSPACICVRRRTHNTPRTTRECRVLPKEYCLHRTVVPFGWCPCALFIELLFTSPETQRRHGDLHHFCAAHVTGSRLSQRGHASASIHVCTCTSQQELDQCVLPDVVPSCFIASAHVPCDVTNDVRMWHHNGYTT